MTRKAKHSASRCPAQQAADSYTIPLPTQNNLTTTNSQVRWPGKACGAMAFALTFLPACLPAGYFFCPSLSASGGKKVNK